MDRAEFTYLKDNIQELSDFEMYELLNFYVYDWFKDRNYKHYASEIENVADFVHDKYLEAMEDMHDDEHSEEIKKEPIS